MDEEEFRDENIKLMREQTIYMKLMCKENAESHKEITDNMVTQDDHKRVESKIEKIWDEVLVMGVVIAEIAAAVGVVGWVR